MPKSKQRERKRPGRNRRFEKKMEAVQRLNPFVTNYIQKLEAENEKMKTDPGSAVGQIIPQLRDAISQNKRLSVLAAALIDTHGGSVRLTKEALEVFETKILSIKWTLPEGVEKADEAPEFIFTYDALTQEEAAAKSQPTPVDEICEKCSYAPCACAEREYGNGEEQDSEDLETPVVTEESTDEDELTFGEVEEEIS